MKRIMTCLLLSTLGLAQAQDMLWDEDGYDSHSMSSSQESSDSESESEIDPLYHYRMADMYRNQLRKNKEMAVSDYWMLKREMIGHFYNQIFQGDPALTLPRNRMLSTEQIEIIKAYQHSKLGILKNFFWSSEGMAFSDESALCGYLDMFSPEMSKEIVTFLNELVTLASDENK